MNVNFVKKSNDIVLNDSGRKVKITEEIINLFKRYRQVEKEPEAGGILIGRENAGNTNLVIDFITEPMPEDQRYRYKFLRKDTGHINFFQKLYSENEGIYRYIGEWHTHSENIPHYSFIDSYNWKRIGKEMKSKQQYHIIVGIQEIGIWEYDAVIKEITQMDSIKWEEVFRSENIH